MRKTMVLNFRVIPDDKGDFKLEMFETQKHLYDKIVDPKKEKPKKVDK